MNQKPIIRVSFIALLFMQCSFVLAQPDHLNCGHRHATEMLKNLHPEINAVERAQEEFISDFIQHNKTERIDTTTIYTIPVVFHIIHNYGSENISNENIYDQMDILNRDYRKLNADTLNVISPFQSIIADARIQFKLATVDPWGNCTNGIDRIANTQTYIGNDGSKLNTWPRQKYLNVWVVNNMENGVAGYAYYPSSVYDANSCWIDGVIIRYNYIGSLLPSSLSTSRALTHEIGHWLELQHTWGNNNDPTVACGDDNVEDTPETKGHDNCQNRYDFFCDTHTLPNLSNNTEGLFTFENCNGSSGVIDTTGTFFSTDELSYSNFSSHGISTNSSENGEFAFSNWGLGAADGETSYSNLTGSINTNQYYEVTIGSNEGINLSLSGLTFDIARNETGVRSFAVRSSVNNFASNLPGNFSNTSFGSIQSNNVFFIKNDDTTSLSNCAVTLTGSSFSNIVENNVTFRIYGWNAEDNSGTFSLDNFRFNGSFGTIENVENYMEYSYCSKMFTKGQQARMEGALNSPTAYRDQLWTEENLAATGTDGIHDLACAPQSDFYPSEKFTCVNNTVTFHDLSSDAEATSWAWTFQDGIPSTSNAANPSVQFTSPGWKTVTLTVGNSVGSTTMSQNLAILVSPEWSEVNGLLSESCSINPLDSYWIKNNINNNISTWGYTAVTGYNNEQGALFLNEIDLENGLWNSRGDDQDELITPSMDLSLLSNGTFNFKYAYATQAVNLSDFTETLEIWSTKNCGETWTLRETISGLDLVTDGVYISQFVPNSNNQWRDFSFAIPASLETGDVRFKFVFNSSDFSNNLYLDEINISGNVGLDEMGQLKPIQLYPNPTRDILSIKLSDNASKALSRIDIRDISGKLIKQLPVSGFRNNITVDVQDLSEGVYFIQFLMQNGILNETFVKASN